MNKKILTIGTISVISIPAVVVSCGSDESKPKVNTSTGDKPTDTIQNPSTPQTLEIYDQVFDDALRIRNIKDHNINWSLIASHGNTIYSANDYHELLEKATIRNT